MGLKTPEINGARQDLPHLESPEVNGARQPIAGVKKYVDGAWQEIWNSFPSDYIVYDGKLSSKYTVSTSVTDTSTSSVEPDPEISSDGISTTVYCCPTGSRDNTVTGYVTYSPALSVQNYQYVYVKLKTSFRGLNVLYDDQISLSLGIHLVNANNTIRRSGTELSTDSEGYVTYRINTITETQALSVQLRPQITYYTGIPSGWKYYDIDIKDIWCE